MKYFIFVLFLTSLCAKDLETKKLEQTIPRLLEVGKGAKTEDSQKVLPRLLEAPQKKIEKKVVTGENQITEKIKVLDRVEVNKGIVIDSEALDEKDMLKTVEASPTIVKDADIETQKEISLENSTKVSSLPEENIQKRIYQEPSISNSTTTLKQKVNQHNIETIESVQSAKYYKNDFKPYERDLTRQQMLREAKYLKQKYLHAITKLENWEIEKEEKKREFFRKYSHEDTSFGADNEYGKKRADRRKKEFFQSLAIQEKHIQERVEDALIKLSDIKAEFLYKFAVPLTEAEMNGGTPPTIENRAKRVEMLQNYISENSAWQKCRQKVAEFDRVNRVANSIENLFPEVNLTSQTISAKMEQNKQEMKEHASRFNNIEKNYRLEYGVSISNAQRAKMILDSITH